jgi:hypothetical protein
MIREAIIFIGVAACFLGHKSMVRLFERTYEIMKKVIPELPQIYRAYIPKVIRSCMEELSQND